MKDYIVAYRCFCSKWYSLLMTFVFPILIVLFSGAFSLVLGEGGLVILTCLISVLEIQGDYFSYNGITAKEYPFGMIKSGYHGPELIRKGIIADGVRRFTNIAVMYLVTVFVVRSLAGRNVPDDLWCFGFILSLFTYSVITACLIVLRNITSFGWYGSLMWIIVILFGLIAQMIVYPIYAGRHMNIILLMILFAVTAFVATKWSQIYVLKKYADSFREESAA